MSNAAELSRRERQIMDIVFAQGEATVNQICDALPDPPTPMAVRRMMHILEEKDHLKRREQGREVVYMPRETKDKAGRTAFQRVLETHPHRRVHHRRAPIGIRSECCVPRSSPTQTKLFERLRHLGERPHRPHYWRSIPRAVERWRIVERVLGGVAQSRWPQYQQRNHAASFNNLIGAGEQCRRHGLFMAEIATAE